MPTESLSHFAENCRLHIEAILKQLLPEDRIIPISLHAAMRYAAMAPGKRVRPLLVYATGQALNCSRSRLDSAAASVELIHAFSLVHDDLPAMDDDELRRGQPTCHKKFDEATAILAGDALQTLAFQILAQDSADLSATTRLKMVECLALASGSRGMAGGQALDMEATNHASPLTLPELENIHIHKTGALIRASVNMACLAADANRQVYAQLDHYAKCIGLAFQIRDDILDIESDTGTLGKTGGKDQLQDKATYPALMGLANAKEKADLLAEDALNCLRNFDEKAAPLRQLADYIVHREK